MLTLKNILRTEELARSYGDTTRHVFGQSAFPPGRSPYNTPPVIQDGSKKTVIVHVERDEVAGKFTVTTKPPTE